MSQVLTLGFSPCPNDTFMFHHLVHGGAADFDLEFHCELHDIETLNQLSQEAPPPLDVTKLSIPAMARCSDHYTLLPAGEPQHCQPAKPNTLLPGCQTRPRSLIQR